MYLDPAIWYFITVAVLKQKLKHSVDIYGSIFEISVTQQRKKNKWPQKTPPNTGNCFSSLHGSFEISYRRFDQGTSPVVLHLSPRFEIPLEM